MDEGQKVLLGVASNLANDFIYYSPALEHLRFERDDKIETLAITPRLVVLYNLEFVKGKSRNELRGLVLHEVMHFLSEHHKRELNHPWLKTVDHILHNVAMDMEINCRIKQLDRVELPSDGCYPETFKLPDGTLHPLPDGLTYEQYLRLIIQALRKFLQDPKNSKYIAKDGQGLKIGGGNPVNGNGQYKANDLNQGNDDGSGGYSPNTDMLADKLKSSGEERVAKSRGDGSGGSEVIRDVTEKRYPWSQILRDVVYRTNSRIAHGYEFATYKYFNKNNDGDILKPVFRQTEFELNLVVIMDVSGSMYDIILDMYQKLKSIVHSVSGSVKTTIIEVDTEVLNVIKDFDLSSRTIRSTNGGGTDLRCAWDYIADHRMKPDLIVCMSDGYTPWKQPGEKNMMKDKTVCILSDTSNDCPYTNYPSEF